MTSLLPPPLRRHRPEEPPAPPAPLTSSGLLAALRAAAISGVFVALLVIVAWAADPRSGSVAEAALRTAGQVWLVGHRVPLAVPGGVFGLTPLGVLALPGALLVLAGRRAARQSQPARTRERMLLVAVLATTYAAVAGLVAVLARTPAVEPSAGWAAVCGLLLAATAGGCGVLSVSGGRELLAEHLPRSVAAVLAAAAAGTSVLLAAGAALAGTALLLQADRVVALSRALEPGVTGGCLLALLGIALAPNVAVWGSAVAVGPGFAVGQDTSVTAIGADVGAVPALPLLGALPDAGVLPSPLLVVYAVPVVAGVMTGFVLLRRLATAGTGSVGLLRGAAYAASSGIAAGALLALLAALSGGPVAGGRLAAVGPSPWQVGLAAGLELAAVAAATAWFRLRT